MNDNEKNISQRQNKIMVVCAMVFILLLLVYSLFLILPQKNPKEAKPAMVKSEITEDIQESMKDTENTTDKVETAPPAEEADPITLRTEKASELILSISGVSGIDELTKEQLVKHDMALSVVKQIYSEYGIGDMADIKASQYLSEYFGFDMTRFDQTQYFIDVPYISLEGSYPNGCESVSATMILQHLGYNITVDTFIDRYLSCLPYEKKNGVAYAPDPETVYVGDPRSSSHGYGCYPPVIVDSLNKYLQKDHRAINLTGTSIDKLRTEYLANGIPVAIWVTIDFNDITRYITWMTEDDRQIFYPANLHCMVLCGYDGENYIFKDPYSSNGTVSYPIEKVDKIYSSMGYRAIAVVKD